MLDSLNRIYSPPLKPVVLVDSPHPSCRPSPRGVSLRARSNDEETALEHWAERGDVVIGWDRATRKGTAFHDFSHERMRDRIEGVTCKGSALLFTKPFEGFYE